MKKKTTTLFNLILLLLCAIYVAGMVLALRPYEDSVFTAEEVSDNIKDCYSVINQFPIITRNDKGQVTNMYCNEGKVYEPNGQ